ATASQSLALDKSAQSEVIRTSEPQRRKERRIQRERGAASKVHLAVQVGRKVASIGGEQVGRGERCRQNVGDADLSVSDIEVKCLGKETDIRTRHPHFDRYGRRRCRQRSCARSAEIDIVRTCQPGKRY